MKKIFCIATIICGIATIIWYCIAIKNFIFVFKSLRLVGIIGVSDWKVSLSMMFELGYIWDLIFAILFMVLNTIIATMQTRAVLGKQFSKRTKIMLCVLLAVLLLFFILVPFYKYFWALYAVFKRFKLISIFGNVYFVIIVATLALNILALKVKNTKDFLQHSNKTPAKFIESSVQKRKEGIK